MQDLTRKDFLDAYQDINPPEVLVSATITRAKAMRKKRELQSLIQRCGMAAAAFAFAFGMTRAFDLSSQIEVVSGNPIDTASIFSDLSLTLTLGVLFVGACGVFLYLYWKNVHKK